MSAVKDILNWSKSEGSRSMLLGMTSAAILGAESNRLTLDHGRDSGQLTCNLKYRAGSPVVTELVNVVLPFASK